MKKEVTFTENLISYLQFIQNAIDRMSTSSALFKGFSATIVAGLSIISYKDIKSIVLILSFIPIICFMCLDIYYLRLERRYRELYNDIRTGEKPIDFDMRAPKVSEIVKKNKKTNTKLSKCVFSKSIVLFYFPLLGIWLVVFILKMKGVLQ